MKRIYAILVAVLLTASVFAQTPEKMSYQSVVRDANSNLITNTQVGLQVRILQGSATGAEVYIETQTPTTNANGLLSVEIGGQTGFDTITWANGPYFIETSIDPTGGNSYTITGTSQLLSVPYALHAKTAESITGGITETDPVYTAWDKSYNDLTNKPKIVDTISAVLDTTTQFVKTEVDGSITNEIQDLTLTSNTLTITNNTSATNIDLNPYLDNTDNQNLDNVLTQGTSANNKNITNLADPVNAQDAATKVYVDQMMQIMENNGLTFVDFTANSTTTTVNNAINFTDNSAINPTTWSWDFGDGNTATTQNPTHAYTTAGTYTVSLTASNGTLTKTETKTNYITVNTDGPGAGLTDYDGNNYTSIIIGGQEWMAENLKVTHYPNGDPIPLVINNSAWGDLGDNNTDDAYSFYDNSSTNATTYGALYTYAAAIGDNWQRDNSTTNGEGGQGVCPDGWHLPTDAEWTTLEIYLAPNAGSKLAGNEPLWQDGSLDQSADFGTSGFSALPGGYRTYNGGTFGDLGDYGGWWCATEHSSYNAYYRFLLYYHQYVSSFSDRKSYGFSVRCVRD